MSELDVLLVQAPSPNPGLMLSFEFQGMPPLGIGYLATYLKKNLYTVRILDMSFQKNTINTLLSIMDEDNPKVIGLSATTETYQSAIRIAEMIKIKSPEVVVVMGGAHVSFEYEEALNTGFVDVVEIGEGEISLKNLCDCLLRGDKNLSKIKGISYMKNGKVQVNEREELICNLDELPFPDRTLYGSLDNYAHPATCSTSRGCPGKCIFCAASGLSGGQYRMRSAKNIVDEFEYLKSLGYTHVDIVDDTMTASIKRLHTFMDELQSRKLGMTWYCESRVDVMTKELLLKMKDCGLTLIQFGVEAGSQEMLDCLKKHITISQIHNVFRWCKELGIEASTNLIIGQPYDTYDTIRDTLQIAEEIANLGVYVNFTVCTPFPGTYMWDHLEEFNLEIIDRDLDYYTTFYPVYNSKHLTANEIRNAYYNAVIRLHELQPNNVNPSAKKYIRRVNNVNV